MAVQALAFVPLAAVALSGHIATGAGMAASAGWTPWTARVVSSRRVITVSAIGIAPIPLLWLVSDSFWWFLGIQTYSGIAWAGFELGMLMALFDADDDAERTTTQVAFSAVLASFGTDHRAYLAVFIVSSIARFAAVMLLVRRLPMLLARGRWPGTCCDPAARESLLRLGACSVTSPVASTTECAVRSTWRERRGYGSTCSSPRSRLW